MNHIKRNYIGSAAFAAALLSSTSAFAMPTPVDLSTWEAERLPMGSPNANWTVQNAPANDEVFQSVNSGPSVFFDPTLQAQGNALNGTITVETSGDDDFIGFVLGYDDDELFSNDADFILIDWKQGTQTFGGLGTGIEGLSISRVSGDVNTTSERDFWEHSGTVDEIARASSLGDVGWEDFTTYAFELFFTEDLIEVSVDGMLELSVTAADAGVAAFDDGSFGFYNYSQSSVRYSSISNQVLPPPPPTPTPPTPPGPTPMSEPGSIALLGLGIVGLGVARRRNRANDA